MLCWCLQGAHYYFEGVKLAQGRDNVLRHLKENPDTAARVTTAVQAKLAELRSSGKSLSSSKSKKAALTSADLDAELEDFEEELLDDDGLAMDLSKRVDELSEGDDE